MPYNFNTFKQNCFKKIFTTNQNNKQNKHKNVESGLPDAVLCCAVLACCNLALKWYTLILIYPKMMVFALVFALLTQQKAVVKYAQCVKYGKK